VSQARSPASPFQEVLESYYRAWFRYHPEIAVDVGVPGYEHLLTPFLPDDRAALVCLNDQLVVSLDELDTEHLTPDEAIDYEIVRAAALLENQRILDIEPHRPDPEAVLPINAIHQLTIKPVADRTRAIGQRLAAIPKHLELAEAYFEGRAHDVPALWAQSALQAAREGAALFRMLGANEFREVEPAVRAIQRFADFLARDVVPRAHGRFAVGRFYFERLLHGRHFLTADADELHRFGEMLCAETRRELLDACRALTGDTDLSSGLRAALQVPPSAPQLLGAYRDAMEAAKAFLVERDLVTLPACERLHVVETPSFLRHQIPFAAYSEPTRTDPAQQGYYYVTPPEVPEQLAEHGAAAILHTCVHEAWPGHHLQFVTAHGHAAANSLPRVLNPSATLYEGWALYCEQLMHEQGFLAGAAQRFLLLRDRLWRALRIVIDVGIHTRDMSLDQAADHMTRQLGFTRASALADLTWYTRAPTVPLGYAVGWALIAKLRERESGDRQLDLKAFHDRLLSVGSIALPLVVRRAFGQDSAVELQQSLFAGSRYTQ
jgi:uncharacterized protein (DUF885 family)